MSLQPPDGLGGGVRYLAAKPVFFEERARGGEEERIIIDDERGGAAERSGGCGVQGATFLVVVPPDKPSL